MFSFLARRSVVSVPPARKIQRAALVLESLQARELPSVSPVVHHAAPHHPGHHAAPPHHAAMTVPPATPSVPMQAPTPTLPMTPLAPGMWTY